MTSLLIVGAGGHAQVVADAAIESGAWEGVAFVDDHELEHVLDFSVVGTLNDLGRLRAHFAAAVIGIGKAQLRLSLLQRCLEIGYALPTVVHPSAFVSRYAKLGVGSVVLAQAAVNTGSRIESGCIVNTGATVDHDCELAEGVHVCPGVHLGGNVRIGARTWIGIGASVKHGIHIGSDVMVGAGAAVVRDIDAGVTAVGVPARMRVSRQ
jgi:sugar O-acyltransferase (sialic acid O-acetyltransferase NeuD family)